MAIKVDILTPLGYQDSSPVAISSAIASNVTFNVQGYSAVVLQIDTPNDAAAAGTLTLQCSQTGAAWHDFPAGAVSYTSAGVKAAVNVEGLVFVRVQVTTTSGTVEYAVTMTGVRDE
jgi:hypothetical protein